MGEWLLQYADRIRQPPHDNGFDAFLYTYGPVLYWPPNGRKQSEQLDYYDNALTEFCPGFDFQPKPPGDAKPRGDEISAGIADFIAGNSRLAELRRYILIVTDDHPPPANAYVAHFDRGKWYYIDGGDRISQRNFELVSLFLTMMAVPSTTQPLTPTINVGGG